MTRTVPVQRLISFLTFALGLSLALPSHAVTVAEAVAAARNTQLPDIDGIMANHDGVLDALGGGSTEGLDDVKNLWANGKGTLTGSAEASVIECRGKTDTTCRAIQVLDKGFPERPVIGEDVLAGRDEIVNNPTVTPDDNGTCKDVTIEADPVEVTKTCRAGGWWNEKACRIGPVEIGKVTAKYFACAEGEGTSSERSCLTTISGKPASSVWTERCFFGKESSSASGTITEETSAVARAIFSGVCTSTDATTETVKCSELTVKLANEDLTKDLTSDDVTSDQAKQLLGNVAAEGVETTMKVDEGMYNEGFIIDSEAKVHSTGPNSVMQSTLELATIAPLALNRILTNDVHKRMGDIRSMKQTSGAWARYDGGRLSAESGLENDFHTIQVGVDTVPTAGAPRFGVAFSYTMSDADYRRGKADMDVYSLAAYGLWMGENGQFADVVARLGTAKTDMTVDGNKKGSMDNLVTALSGEFGWRFDLSKSFYLEPQVELAYTHVDADVLSLSDGSTYRFDDADSLMGRAGFAFGMRCPENGSTAYLRVSAVHEFLGDNAVIGGNGKVYDIDGKDTWVEYGLGANFNLTDSTYVWADVERTSGGYLDEDWRATVGVRHAF